MPVPLTLHAESAQEGLISAVTLHVTAFTLKTAYIWISSVTWNTKGFAVPKSSPSSVSQWSNAKLLFATAVKTASSL